LQLTASREIVRFGRLFPARSRQLNANPLAGRPFIAVVQNQLVKPVMLKLILFQSLFQTFQAD
jgi:hypothetical protein